MAIPVATLQQWLDEALTAQHALMTGKIAVKLRSGDEELEFTRQNAADLDAWIAKLQTWIANGGISTSGVHRPIYFGF